METLSCIQPDTAFLQDVLAEGGEDLKRCFQCATCCIVCELSNGEGSHFPRREMIWAQWGLKDRIVADPDIWLCYHCNECSARCPRGARPGDVLAALRRETVLHYAIPQCIGKWLNRAGSLPLLFLIPVVVLGLAILARDPLQRLLSLEQSPELYAGFFPHWLLISLFSLCTGLSLLAAIVGVTRFWRAMKEADQASDRDVPPVGLTASILDTLKVVASHRRFGQCGAEITRRTSHMLAFYGFIALFVVTVWAVLDIYVMPMLGIHSLYPFGLLHPFKILANVGCAMLIVGCALALRHRLANKQEVGVSTLFDWFFLLDLLAVGVTGLFAEILRFAVGQAHPSPLASVAYVNYFIHLVFVFTLLVYLPYGKFAHLLYRTAALVFADRTGRNIAIAEKSNIH